MDYSLFEEKHHLIDVIVRVRLYGSPQEDIKDIISAIKLALLDNLHRGLYDSSKGGFGGYMYGTITNHLKRYYRDKKINYKIDYELNHEHTIYIDGINEQLHIDRLHAQNILRVALEELSDIHQEVIKLRFYNELSTKEIAEKTGLSTRDVRNKCSYGLKKLRKTIYDIEKVQPRK